MLLKQKKLAFYDSPKTIFDDKLLGLTVSFVFQNIVSLLPYLSSLQYGNVLIMSSLVE